MAVLTANNAYSTLGGSISNSATTIPLATGTGVRFPVVTAPDVLYVTFQDGANNIEVVKCTAHTAGADSFTAVRAQDGTTARAWNIGDVVEARLTSGVINDLKTDIKTDVQTAVAAVTVQKSSATGAAHIPAGTTAQRDASPQFGDQRANSTTGAMEWWNGTSWSPMGGGATGAGGDTVFQENGTVVNNDYTLSSGKNAMVVGPLSVATGKKLTVPSGQRLVIL